MTKLTQFYLFVVYKFAHEQYFPIYNLQVMGTTIKMEPSSSTFFQDYSGSFSVDTIHSAIEDEDMTDFAPSTTATLEPQDRRRVFKIGVDFGTTFSAVAFVNPYEDSEQDFELLHRDEVKCIVNYPHDPSHYGGVRPEVPSEIWYTLIIFYVQRPFF